MGMTGDLRADVGVDELDAAHLLNLLNNSLQYFYVGIQRRPNRHVQIQRQFILIVRRDPISADAGIERNCGRKNRQGQNTDDEAMIERPCQKPPIPGGKTVEKSDSFSGAVFFFAGFRTAALQQK